MLLPFAERERVDPKYYPLIFEANVTQYENYKTEEFIPVIRQQPGRVRPYRSAGTVSPLDKRLKVRVFLIGGDALAIGRTRFEYLAGWTCDADIWKNL